MPRPTSRTRRASWPRCSGCLAGGRGRLEAWNLPPTSRRIRCAVGDGRAQTPGPGRERAAAERRPRRAVAGPPGAAARPRGEWRRPADTERERHVGLLRIVDTAAAVRSQPGRDCARLRRGRRRNADSRGRNRRSTCRHRAHASHDGQQAPDAGDVRNRCHRAPAGAPPDGRGFLPGRPGAGSWSCSTRRGR